MHDGVDFVRAEDFLQERRIAGISDNQVAMGYGRFEAGRQVIQRNDVLVRCAELSDNVAANVSGTAGYQYGLVFHSIFRLVKKNRRNCEPGERSKDKV